MTSSPFGSPTHEEGESGSLGVLWSDKASGSTEFPAPATAAQSSSSNNADSLESTLGSPTRALTPIANQPKRWCVDGQYQVYSDAMFCNYKRVTTRTLTLERRVLKGSLFTMQEIDYHFTRHRLEWIARSLHRYSEE